MILRKSLSTVSSMARQLKPIHIIPCTGPKHSATVIFFHGSGSIAEHMRYGVAATIGKDFSFPHIKVVFPTAPLQPYTPFDGELSNVWFDRLAISDSVPEILESVEEIGEDVKKLIEKENEAGIPNNRIVVGGFSMGGCLALHLGYRWHTDLAGVFALSSFLNKGSVVYEYLKNNSNVRTPELLQYHGEHDELVPLSSGRQTFEKLQSLGVKGNFHVESKIHHSVTKPELLNVHSWISNQLPPI